MFNTQVYRSYDIRGIVGQEIEAGEAYHIGRAYAEHMGAKQVVVARDMRPSGDEFEPELVRGLTDAGVDVVRIGQATTPMFYFAIHKLKTDGGLIVTASHNPAEYNGMKMARAEAVPIAADSGLMEIRDLVEKREWAEVDKKGKVSEAEVRDDYIKMVTDGYEGVAEGKTIVVDAGNGMTGLILEQVWEKLGGKVIPLYWEPDGTFPNHEANPLVEDNMKDLKLAIAENKADLGVAFDGDGDRVFFATEKGDTVAGDITTALLAEELLEKDPGATILYDLRASRATREVIEEAGGEAVMSRVGHSFIKAMMREEKAIFAGEVSGHFYFTPLYAESAMMALVTLLQLMKDKDKKLSELSDPLVARYATSPEINYEVEDKEGTMKKIEDHYRAEADEILDLDGLTVRFADWWCNIRPSGTEPLLRMKVEARTPELLEERQAELQDMIGSEPVQF